MSQSRLEPTTTWLMGHHIPLGQRPYGEVLNCWLSTHSQKLKFEEELIEYFIKFSLYNSLLPIDRSFIQLYLPYNHYNQINIAK